MLKKVLYIDDELINLQLFEIHFEDAYQVRTTSDPLEGLRIINEEPDIAAVVSDYKMPKMDGIELIKKAVELHPNMIFFVISGFDLNKEIKDLIDSGTVKEYFRKPFDLEIMEERLDRILNESTEES